MSFRLASLSIAAALFGCAEEPPPESRVVLEVAGRASTLGELDRFIRMSVRQESPVLSSEVTAALFDQFVEEQLLLRAAEDAGIEIEPEAVAEKMKALRSAPVEQGGEGFSSAGAPDEEDEEELARQLEKQLRIERLISREALAGLAVEDEEVQSYYESHRDDFRRPESVNVSQILVGTEALANDLRKQVLSRKSTFEELAREHSLGPEAPEGGNLGSFTRGELPPSFESEVFGLAPGAVSEVVGTDFGYHIFRVNSREEETSLELEDVRDAVRVELLRQKSDQAMKLFLSELEMRYPVTVHQQHLSFAISPLYDRARDGNEAKLEGKIR